MRYRLTDEQQSVLNTIMYHMKCCAEIQEDVCGIQRYKELRDEISTSTIHSNDVEDILDALLAVDESISIVYEDIKNDRLEKIG